MTAALATIELPPPRRHRMPAGTPAVYFVALVVIALMLGPVLYIILGGFRTNSQITTDPGGLPDPWVWTNYRDVLTGGVFWQLVLNSTLVGVATIVVSAWEGELDRDKLARGLSRRVDPSDVETAVTTG